MGADRVECVACGGSGTSSKGTPCHPCGGTGSLQAKAEGNAQHSSATAEHYTPAEIVNAARLTLGAIDLDPASCALAQDVVKAAAWYGPGSPFGEDGLTEPWLGRVFLNPPGGRVPDAFKGMGTASSAALWWATLSEAWRTGEVEAAIFVGFTLEILRSAQALDVIQPLDFPLCVPKSRIAFDTVSPPSGIPGDSGTCDTDRIRVPSTSPTHANVIVFLPPTTEGNWTSSAVEPFLRAFGPFGSIRA